MEALITDGVYGIGSAVEGAQLRIGPGLTDGTGQDVQCRDFIIYGNDFHGILLLLKY